MIIPAAVRISELWFTRGDKLGKGPNSSISSTGVVDGMYLKRKHLTMLLLLIAIIGLVLRIISLGQSFWLDEAISANVVRNYTFSEIITKFSPSDFHPPLYYLVLKYWASIFGFSEIALRSLSIGFGVASMWCIYKIGKQLFSPAVGLLAALFLATAPLHIYYSQEARMYTMETFLALLSFYLFVKIIHNEKQDSWPFWLAFTISNIALLYTDYLPTILFDVFLFWLAFAKGMRSKYFLKLCASLLITAIAFVPFLPIFFNQLTLGTQANTTAWATVLGKATVKNFVLLFVKFSIGRISFENKLIYGLFVLMPAVLFGWLSIKAVLAKQKTVLLIVLWLMFPIVAGLLVALKLSIFDYFRFLFVLPALYLLLAIGCQSLAQKPIKALSIAGVLVINVVASGIYFFNPVFHREDWQGAVRYIESHSHEGAVTIFVNPAQADAYTYYSNGIVSVSGPIDVDTHAYKTIWLMRYVQDIFDPHDGVRSSIEKAGYEKVAEHDFDRVIFWEYRTL